MIPLSPSDTALRGIPDRMPRSARPRSRQRLFTWPLLVGVVVVLALVTLSLFVGVYDIWNDPDGLTVFFATRIPRTVGLVLAGAAMAMCGLVMQMLTQNRFVEPTTTGTTEWAGLGLLLVMLLFPEAPLMARMIGAVIAAFVGTMLFFLFLRRVMLTSSIIVPIVGMMLGAVVGAISTYVALSTNMLQSMAIWFTGSFTSVMRGYYEPLWVVLIVVVIIFIAADRFTIAGLGEQVATSVGLDYRRILLIGTMLIALATGVVTVVVGNLPFLGLIVPNVVSLMRGDDLRSNLPWVALGGVALITACDILARVVNMPFEVPVSLILAMVGSVAFIALLLRQRRRA